MRDDIFLKYQHADYLELQTSTRIFQVGKSSNEATPEGPNPVLKEEAI